MKTNFVSQAHEVDILKTGLCKYVGAPTYLTASRSLQSGRPLLVGRRHIRLILHEHALHEDKKGRKEHIVFRGTLLSIYGTYC